LNQGDIGKKETTLERARRKWGLSVSAATCPLQEPIGVARVYDPVDIGKKETPSIDRGGEGGGSPFLQPLVCSKN
jgi:hypothetical protein